MSHFKNFSVAPKNVLLAAYFYILCIGIFLYFSGFYINSTFFNWGVPVCFFGQQITSEKTFYTIIFILFIHQIINNYINSVVYPWIINSVQDPKNIFMEYSRFCTLVLINLFDIYSQIDTVIIISGFSSQISFVSVVVIANILTSTYINNQYITKKTEKQQLCNYENNIDDKQYLFIV